MSKISEFFGLNCRDASLNFKKAMDSQLCPYTQRICTKMRKSDPDVKIGTCSVRYQSQDVIICPFRLLEHNQIFIDCLHLLTMHEPGNELYLIPEVQIPGGHVDYFLVSAKDKKVKDFIGVEIEKPDDEMYGIIKAIYDDISNELGFGVPFDPMAVSQVNNGEYNVTRALIESVAGGTDSFVTEGTVTRITVPGGSGQLPQQGIQTTKTFEGWKHGTGTDNRADSPADN